MSKGSTKWLYENWIQSMCTINIKLSFAMNCNMALAHDLINTDHSGDQM